MTLVGLLNDAAIGIPLHDLLIIDPFVPLQVCLWGIVHLRQIRLLSL